MSMKTLKDKKRLILGLGQTGLSVARFLHKAGQEFHVMDTRDQAPGLDELNQFAPNAYMLWNSEVFTEFDEIVVSPGIAIAQPEIQAAAQSGVTIIGDIELFAQVNQTSVIAITGSNGKSTVTDLVTELINASGKKAIAAGNFGVPALDVVDQNYDFIVLELSSFQLETTYTLKSEVATILNICEDHLDRYDSYQDYINTKQRIYKNTKTKVVNADDDLTWTLDDKQVQYGIANDENDLNWSLDIENKQIKNRDKAILNLSDVQLQGLHNGLNITASFALIEAAGIDISESVLNTAKKYSGLEHRCQLVCKNDALTFINDSKATNVGATVAALNSFEPLYENIILIAGGDAKGADLSSLKAVLQAVVRAVVTFGQDAKAIALLCPGKSYLVENMAQAVVKAKQLTEQEKYSHSLILLSPACASLDMYKNYQARGDEFSKFARAIAC